MNEKIMGEMRGGNGREERKEREEKGREIIIIKKK